MSESQLSSCPVAAHIILKDCTRIVTKTAWVTVSWEGDWRLVVVAQ